MIRTNKHRSKYSISINHNKNPNYKEVYILGTKSIMSSIEKDGRYIPISLINITNFQICNILNKENKKHLKLPENKNSDKLQ